MYIELDNKLGGSETFYQIKGVRIFDKIGESPCLISISETDKGKKITVRFQNKVKETIVTLIK